MLLNQSQIKHIDDYLKYHKVDYWDIRIELLDHMVSKVETLMEDGKSFESALEEVHVGFGNKMKRFWNKGVEESIFAWGNGYEKLLKNKILKLCRSYVKELLSETYKSIQTKLGFFIFAFFIILNYLTIYKIFPEWFKWILVTIMVSPYFMADYLIKMKFPVFKKEKILHVLSAYGLISFLFSFYLVIVFLIPISVHFNWDKNTYNIILMLFSSLFLFFNLNAINLLNKKLVIFSEIYKKYQLI